MGQRIIVRGANWAGNAIDSMTPSTTYYPVTYTLSNATSSVSVNRVAAGSSFSVTLTPLSGYTMSSCVVTHNGLQVAPTGNTYTYSIGNVSGPITITALATHQSVEQTYHSSDVDWTLGAYINVETNVPKSNNTYAYTDYISVSGFSSITSVNHPPHAVAFYDSNKNYLSGWVDQAVTGVYASTPSTTSIPSGAAYIRCNSVRATNVSPLTNWSITLTE